MYRQSGGGGQRGRFAARPAHHGGGHHPNDRPAGGKGLRGRDRTVNFGKGISPWCIHRMHRMSALKGGDTMKKKLFGVLMAMTLCLGMLPTAWADEETAAEPVSDAAIYDVSELSKHCNPDSVTNPFYYGTGISARRSPLPTPGPRKSVSSLIHGKVLILPYRRFRRVRLLRENRLHLLLRQNGDSASERIMAVSIYTFMKMLGRPVR